MRLILLILLVWGIYYFLKHKSSSSSNHHSDFMSASVNNDFNSNNSLSPRAIEIVNKKLQSMLHAKDVVNNSNSISDVIKYYDILIDTLSFLCKYSPEELHAAGIIVGEDLSEKMRWIINNKVKIFNYALDRHFKDRDFNKCYAEALGLKDKLPLETQEYLYGLKNGHSSKLDIVSTKFDDVDYFEISSHYRSLYTKPEELQMMDEAIFTTKQMMERHFPNPLYPFEVLMLSYSEKYENTMKTFPAFWIFQIGIGSPNFLLQSLTKRGYLTLGTCKDSLALLRNSELKEILKHLGLPVSGKKEVLISRIQKNINEEGLNQYIPFRKYKLTELGKSVLEKYPSIPEFFRFGASIWLAYELAQSKTDNGRLYEEFLESKDFINHPGISEDGLKVIGMKRVEDEGTSYTQYTYEDGSKETVVGSSSVFEKYFALLGIITSSKNIEARLHACEESYKILPEVMRLFKKDDAIPPYIPCRDCGPNLYIENKQYDKAIEAIEKCLAAGAYITAEDMAEAKEYIDEIKDIAYSESNS